MREFIDIIPKEFRLVDSVVHLNKRNIQFHLKLIREVIHNLFF